MLDIKVTKTAAPKPKPEGDLGFGRIFTDHMFMMNYTEGRGWHDPRIQPYGELSLSPASMVFHYGQEMFEGMKAYKGKDGEVYLFRPEMNGARLNATNQRLSIPQLPVEDFVQAVSAIVKHEADWVPSDPGTSLYIRPFIIATEPFLGVEPSKEYLFIIILSPSGSYYTGGAKPVGIWVEENYVRAVRGGVGFAKVGGNYAASMAAQAEAKAAGYAQVLWLDGVERKYIEEVGSMNIVFKIDGKVVTPALNGSILPGITRNSIITLCQDWGLPVEERAISIDELTEAAGTGKLEEAFGVGTAAVVTPVGKFCYKGEVFTVADEEAGPLSQRLRDALVGIQTGQAEDKHGWRVTL